MSTKLVSVIFLFAGLVLVHLSPLAAQEQDSELPEQIEEYYGSCNIVNLYSTAAEREALFRSPRYGLTTDMIFSERLQIILGLIYRLKEMEHKIDPWITRGESPPSFHVPSGLAVVEGCDFLPKGKLRINITVYQDDKDLIRRLVSELDRSPGKQLVPPSREELLSMVGGKVARREIHTWIGHEGVWSKQSVNLVLLDG